MDRSQSVSSYIEKFHICNDLRLYSKFSRRGTPSVIFIAGLGDSCETWSGIQDVERHRKVSDIIFEFKK